MRYVKIPQHSSVSTVLTKEGEPMQYPFQLFLNELVWTSKKWRNSDDPEMQAAMLRMYELFEGRVPGDVVALQDKDHEKLSKIASQDDVDLGPGLVVLVMKHVHAITGAPSKEE
jgi:hypothetical protein